MLDTWYKSREREITGWLRNLHQHSELGFEETRTSAVIASQMRTHLVALVQQVARSTETFHGVAVKIESRRVTGQGGADCHDPKSIFDPVVIPVGAPMPSDLASSRTSHGRKSK